MTFDEAFERVIGHEGGYSNDYYDRGNWTSGIVGVGELKGTKYGIAAHVYPGRDIVNLTLEDAKTIYWADYWVPMDLDKFPPEFHFDLFDSAVNHGKATTIRFMQRALDVADDGFVGPVTVLAARQMAPERFIARFNGQRLLFYTKLSTWSKFGTGWARRVARNLMEV